MEKLRYGIVGIGNMGTNHVKMYKDGKIKEMELTAVCDVKEERLDFAKNEVPGVKTFSDFDDLIKSGLIDAVIIATPHYFHPPMAKKALENGIHVLSEKPAGVYTKDVRELIEYAETQDKTYAIMFNQRTNCVYRKVKELVSSGKYGDIRRSNWIITDWYRSQEYYNSGGWRATWNGEGGGVLMNQAPHNLDLWQWICGMPEKIRAFCKTGLWHDIEVEDDVTIFAEYPNGATGTFITSTGDFPGDNRFEITLDKAKIVCTADDIELYELENKLSDYTYDLTHDGFEKPKFKKVQVETDGENEQHAGVTNAFAAHILHGDPLTAEGKEGIKGLTIANAAYLSSWLNKTVELPLDEDLYLEELNKRRAASKVKTNVSESVKTDMSNSF